MQCRHVFVTMKSCATFLRLSILAFCDKLHSFIHSFITSFLPSLIHLQRPWACNHNPTPKPNLAVIHFKVILSFLRSLIHLLSYLFIYIHSFCHSLSALAATVLVSSMLANARATAVLATAALSSMFAKTSTSCKSASVPALPAVQFLLLVKA